MLPCFPSNNLLKTKAQPTGGGGTRRVVAISVSLACVVASFTSFASGRARSLSRSAAPPFPCKGAPLHGKPRAKEASPRGLQPSVLRLPGAPGTVRPTWYEGYRDRPPLRAVCTQPVSHSFSAASDAAHRLAPAQGSPARRAFCILSIFSLPTPHSSDIIYKQRGV